MKNIENNTARRLLTIAASGVLTLGALAGMGAASAQTTAPSMPGQMRSGQMQPGQMQPGQPRTLTVRYYDADPRKGGKLISTLNVRVGRPMNAPGGVPTAVGQHPIPSTTTNGQQPGNGRLEDNRGPAVAPATAAQRPGTPSMPGQMRGMGRMGAGRAILAAAPQGAHYARYTNRAGTNVYLNLDALRRMPAPMPGR